MKKVIQHYESIFFFKKGKLTKISNFKLTHEKRVVLPGTNSGPLAHQALAHRYQPMPVTIPGQPFRTCIGFGMIMYLTSGVNEGNIFYKYYNTLCIKLHPCSII